MKRIVVMFLSLALLLTACGAPTPQTIVITVVPTDAPVVATDVPAPTDAPQATEAPAATDEPTVAATVAPTDTSAPAPTEAAPTETSAPGAKPTNTRPPAVGGSVFSDMTRDIDAFSLKCAPSQINFSVKSINVAIVKVVLFYRVVDKNSTAAAPAMVNSKDMTTTDKVNYTVEFSALDVKDDLRLANGWFDYQFVGLNKAGNVVGRSDKIVQEVTFTLDCP